MPRDSVRIFGSYAAVEATRCSHDSSRRTWPGLDLVSKEANVFSSSDRCITAIGCPLQPSQLQSDSDWQRADLCLNQIEAINYCGICIRRIGLIMYAAADMKSLGSEPCKDTFVHNALPKYEGSLEGWTLSSQYRTLLPN